MLLKKQAWSVIWVLTLSKKKQCGHHLAENIHTFTRVINTAENLTALYGLTPHRGAACYLKDDGRQCGLIVPVLISLRLCVLLPVFLIRFQGLAQPACYIRLKTWTSNRNRNWLDFCSLWHIVIFNEMLTLQVTDMRTWGVGFFCSWMFKEPVYCSAALTVFNCMRT